MSMTNSNTRAPVIEPSIVSKIIDEAPDDLDLGPGEEEKKTIEQDRVEWDDDDDEPKEKPAKKPEKKERAAAKSKEEGEGDEPEDEPEERPNPRAVAKDEREDEDEPKHARLPKDKGTQDKPWTVKDMPEDGFIQVKIDGKPATVTLKEAVSGYIRTETFQSALSRANNTTEEATQIAHDALQERNAMRKYFADVFKTPEKLFERLMQDPDEMLELGQMIAGQFVKWQKGEESLSDHKLALRERRLAAREQAAQEQRQRAQQEQQNTRAMSEAIERWRPVHNEALKENGFPKLTPEFQRVFKALFQAEWDATGGKVTPEAYKKAFKSTMLLVKPESTVQDRTPVPQNDPPRREPTTSNGKNGKGKDWGAMPLNQRLRDRNFLL